MPKADFDIRENGTIDIDAGGIKITGIAPYIDGSPILPFFINREKSSVKYDATEGSVKLSVRSDGDELVISTVLEGFDGAHDIEPVGRAAISGASHVYAQGFGMEGPSGYFPISDKDIRSHGIAGLSGGGSAAALYARDTGSFSTQYSVRKESLMYSEETVLSAGINLEGIPAGYRTGLPDIRILCGTDVTDCMTAAAERIAAFMGARTHMEPGFHWCSWYYHYENMDQSTLDSMLGTGGDERSGLPDFNYIQLDAGYASHVGDWLDFNDRYPGGLGAAAASILEAGFRAGIWIAPFMVGDKSRLYRDHPDWILRERSGEPFVRFRSYTEPKIWGSTDDDYFVLDVTHPEAYAYLKGVFAEFRRMGFTLYKTDFLLWGMQDSSKVVRYDRTKTSVMVMRDCLAMIREAIGDESYLLGSIAPFMPCIGYMDGMRIASDMGAQWTEGAFGPANLLQELPFDNYFNNIFWQNDPDSVILRDFATHLSEPETYSIALLQALSGGVITTSDPVGRLSEDRLRLLSFIRPEDRVRAEFPQLTEDADEIVITHRLNDWDLLYVLNPTQHPLRVHYDLREIFGAKALFQYRFSWDDGSAAVSVKDPFFSDTVGPHRSVLLFVTGSPLDAPPSNLWDRDKR